MRSDSDRRNAKISVESEILVERRFYDCFYDVDLISCRTFTPNRTLEEVFEPFPLRD